MVLTASKNILKLLVWTSYSTSLAFPGLCHSRRCIVLVLTLLWDFFLLQWNYALSLLPPWWSTIRSFWICHYYHRAWFAILAGLLLRVFTPKLVSRQHFGYNRMTQSLDFAETHLLKYIAHVMWTMLPVWWVIMSEVLQSHTWAQPGYHTCFCLPQHGVIVY